MLPRRPATRRRRRIGPQRRSSRHPRAPSRRRRLRRGRRRGGGRRGRSLAERRSATRHERREQAAPDPPAGGGRGGRGSRTEDGRRYSTAGHGLIVALLGLVFGALLLAPGMHKSAFNGQPGTKRDVSLALTGGLAHVSHALLLDRPRSLVQDAMGRDHADEIDVAIVVPPSTVTPNPTTDDEAHASRSSRSRRPGRSSRRRRSSGSGSRATRS